VTTPAFARPTLALKVQSNSTLTLQGEDAAPDFAIKDVP